jgi:hypothetical protein
MYVMPLLGYKFWSVQLFNMLGELARVISIDK